MRSPQVELPSEVQQLLAAFSVWVSFGLNSIGTVLECLGMRGYVNKLALYMAVPLILAVAILLVALGRMLCARQPTATALVETAVPALLKLAFLSYPLVTNVAFGLSRSRFERTLAWHVWPCTDRLNLDPELRRRLFVLRVH